MADRLSPEAEAAALWHARLSDGGSASARARFERWRAGSPDHASAYDRVVRAEGWARDYAATPELQALREETLARIVPARQRVGWRRWALPVAASLLVTAGIGAQLWWIGAPGETGTGVAARSPDRGFATRVGQRATLALADGSRVMLNTASQIRVAYGAGERRVELVRGQAWFEVAKDPNRRFVVAAAGREIIALGTAFDVRIDRGRLEVMLVEGRVTVDQPKQLRGRAVAPSVVLAPSQLLVATPDRVDVRKVADAAPIESWRNGLLIFQNHPLADAVAEFNRYAGRPIRIADAETGAVRISGAFRAEDSRAFLGALEAGFGVRTQSGPDGTVLSLR